MQMLGQESVKNMRDLTEKEERAAFGKRLKRKEVWTAEYRLKQDTAALTPSALDKVEEEGLPKLG